MNSHKRIIKCGEAVEEIHDISKTKRIAMVHGVFDLLHYEHMRLFDFAKQHADYVIVSLVADRFVDKGPGRPVINEQNRAYMLASLRNVDKVIITTSILPLNMIRLYKPHVWVHGGRDHWTPENPLLEEMNIPIVVWDHEHSISTTDIINRSNHV